MIGSHQWRGRSFLKMSGSGNDFVVLDTLEEPLAAMPEPAIVQALCARGRGVGADGLVVLAPSERAAARMIYFNRDGTRGEMCGNAALCCTRLVAERAYASKSDFTLETDSGPLAVGMGSRGRPWITLPAVVGLELTGPTTPRTGEARIGFARVGVPHLVVLWDAAAGEPDVAGRGAELRHAPEFTGGTNVNFVIADRAGGPWRVRTFERGVEAETLACGTGTGACGVLLRAWGLAGADRIAFESRAGLPLTVELPPEVANGVRPRLEGEGRLVFRGTLEEPIG
jgi:diaminopimelate epimerase